MNLNLFLQSVFEVLSKFLNIINEHLMGIFSFFIWIITKLISLQIYRWLHSRAICSTNSRFDLGWLKWVLFVHFWLFISILFIELFFSVSKYWWHYHFVKIDNMILHQFLLFDFIIINYIKFFVSLFYISRTFLKYFFFTIIPNNWFPRFQNLYLFHWICIILLK